MITSLDNDRIKYVRALQSRSRTRRKEEHFVIEGPTLLSEALSADAPLKEVFYTEVFADTDEGRRLLGEISKAGARLMGVDQAVMHAMSDTPTPQGVLGVLADLHLEIPDQVEFALIIDGIADPGNMGTIMRAAVAAGVPLMVTTAGTVDLTNPKVVRSAVGAHFRLPVRPLSWEGIRRRFADHVLLLAELRRGALYYEIDWRQPCALIVSEEAHGPSEPAQRVAHTRVTIPMLGGMESLNVAVATAIMLFERVRQRAQLVPDS
jgi:TrmH family RNA methyltransferase